MGLHQHEPTERLVALQAGAFDAPLRVIPDSAATSLYSSLPAPSLLQSVLVGEPSCL